MLGIGVLPSRLTSGCLRNICFALIDFMVATMLEGWIVGTVWMRKWIWSSSVPISTKWISYLLVISSHVCLRVSAISGLIALRRYFTGNTAWYKISVLLCDLTMCLLTRLAYHTSWPDAERRGNLMDYISLAGWIWWPLLPKQLNGYFFILI